MSGRVGPEPLDGRRSATVINALVSTFSIFFHRLWRCGKISFRVCSQETLFMLDCRIFACIKRTLSPSQPGTSKIRQAWERKTVQERTQRQWQRNMVSNWQVGQFSETSFFVIAIVFVPWRPFQLSLMFVGKVRSFYKSGAPERCFTQTGSSLNHKD